MQIGEGYKVLCLHGIGTNSDILEAQTGQSIRVLESGCIQVDPAGKNVSLHCALPLTSYPASLRYTLKESHTFIFLDGGHPWPPASGIEASFGQLQADNCLSYYDGTAPSAAQAIRDLATYLCENGPFHQVLGFSLGASMIATLLMCPDGEENFQQAKSMVKGAIFICGILPQKWSSLQNGTFEKIRADGMNDSEWRTIDIDTIHDYSVEDSEFGDEGEELLKLCKASTRAKLLHTAGHDIPRRPEEVEALSQAIMSQARRLT